MKASDIRGAARLATDATAGLTSLVEAMHERIARVPGLGGALEGKTSGITGLVYKTIRGATHVVGGTVDALLGLIAPAVGTVEPSAEREAVVAALNGVLGDHLAQSHNPLAITMALRQQGRTLVLERAALAQSLPEASGTLIVALHGLCMNDLQWQRQGHDHAAMLARDLHGTAVYLHYNTGLDLASNGRDFACLMDQLVREWPCPLQRVLLLTHSMGGLVARSALHQGAAAGQAWPARVDELVFMGTPHHGAPLERAGHWVDILLGATPYAAPLARLGRVRSAGITSLRHGQLLAEPGHVPLPAHVRCYAVAASLGDREGDLKHRLLGDGLVPLESALGHHKSAAQTLHIAPERQWVGYGINHMELLNHPGVAAQLQQWLVSAASSDATGV